MEHFLRSHPIFRREHLEAQALGLTPPQSSRALKAMLACWKKEARLHDVRKGLYLSSDAEMPREPSLAVMAAGLSRPDCVVAYQSALWHHLGLPQSSRLPVLAGTHLSWKLALPEKCYTCVPVRLAVASQPERAAWGIETLPCGPVLEVRITDLERSFVDVFDRTDLFDSVERFVDLWKALEQPTALGRLSNLDFDRMLHYLDLLGCATTRAKVGFFLEGHWGTLPITGSLLSKLTPPMGVTRWERRNQGGRYSRRWNLMVPKALTEAEAPLTRLGHDDPPVDAFSGDLQGALKEVFGYDQFREGQEETIRAVLEGRDTLAVLPTGAGKSLTYQLPAKLLGGVTLVISPLLSLMLDQVEEANERSIHARSLNSLTSPEERDEVFDLIKGGGLNLLFLAPESLAGLTRPLRALRNRIRLIVVDEAHCIHDWGKTFRPRYRDLDTLKAIFPVPVLALTATANQYVQQDISTVLGLRDAYVRQLSSFRKNLYIFHHWRGHARRMRSLKSFLQQQQWKPGIVYCQRKRDAEALAKELQDLGYLAETYHADISKEDKPKIQEAFKANRLQIVVATTAFGMGVNKADVRWVVHMGLPLSLSDYIQQIGRAGRDGKPALCLLMYSTPEFDRLREQAAKEDIEETRALRKQQVEELISFLQAKGCRHQGLTAYFGEKLPPCKATRARGSCDVCAPAKAPRLP